jgi:murein DD-endopeptidase MepM/ murein hydrolase activator NlpD
VIDSFEYNDGEQTGAATCGTPGVRRASLSRVPGPGSRVPASGGSRVPASGGSRVPAVAAFCLALLLAATWQDADARRIYKWVDEQGITHYSDRKPDHLDEAQVEGILVRVDGKKPVQLRDERLDSGRAYHARNLLHGPVEIELKLTEALNVISEPPAPVRHVLPAQTEEPVLLISAGAPGEARFQLVMDAVPGDPHARPDADHLWQIPFAEGDPWRIDQAFGGSFSHTHPQSYHAVDFATPAGTPVRAARDGRVMAVESDFYGSGLDKERYGARANYVRLLHSDGSMSLYAHLEHTSVRVHPGQQVQAGQILGHAGDTGFATGPHLHFAVQVNKGMRLETIPFRFGGAQGVFTPEPGMHGGR